MAELAKKYHDDLQKDDPSYPDENIRTTQTESTVKVIPDAQKLNEPENLPMSWLITEANVDEALKSAKNGSATRMDGCLYELWKILKKRHSDDTKAQKKGFNIIKTLTRVFRDIQTHRTEEQNNFALGWMCQSTRKKTKWKLAITDQLRS